MYSRRKIDGAVALERSLIFVVPSESESRDTVSCIARESCKPRPKEEEILDLVANTGGLIIFCVPWRYPGHKHNKPLLRNAPSQLWLEELT